MKRKGLLTTSKRSKHNKRNAWEFTKLAQIPERDGCTLDNTRINYFSGVGDKKPTTPEWP